MGFLDRLQDDLGKRFPKAVSPRDGPQPPGKFSFGTQQLGGPAKTDAFGAKAAPSLTGLVERYHALVYAMVAKNRDAVAKVPMRLLADGTKGQGGPPSRHTQYEKCTRSMGVRLLEEGKISSGAVDNIYEIKNHPLLDVLDDPDPYGSFTREKLIGLLVSYMDVVGSAYLIPEGNGWDWTDDKSRRKGPPEFLWVLYPQWVIPTRTGRSPIVDRFVYFSDRIPYQSAIWFRHNHSLRDAYGSAFSPTYASEPYRAQEQELVTVLSQVMSIGPRPNLIFTAKDAMMGVNPDQRTALEQQLVSKHASYGAGGVLVNDGSWEVTPVDYQKADIGAKELSQHDRDNMAAIFGQPPTYYTIDTNIANLTAADSQFAKFGVEPRCKTVAAQFTRLAKLCDRRMFFAHDPVMPEDDLAKAQVDKIYVDMGAVTINELNEESKYTPKAWGDAPWLPGTLKQPDMITADHQMGLEQGQKAMESQGTQDELAVDGHEHQKKMDKEGLKIEGKKATQKPASKPTRSLDDIAADVLTRIEAELNSMVGS